MRDYTETCPVCNGPASIGPASRSNPAGCGMGGWTADCQAGCDGAPYVTRFTIAAAREAWNTLALAKKASAGTQAEPKGEQP